MEGTGENTHIPEPTGLGEQVAGQASGGRDQGSKTQVRDLDLVAGNGKSGDIPPREESCVFHPVCCPPGSRTVNPGLEQDHSAASSRFSNSLAYYGLAIDLQKFGLSIYLVQVLFGVIDIPAMLVATTTMIYVGRRATVASFLLLAGFMVIANMFVPEGEPSLTFPASLPPFQAPNLTLCLLSMPQPLLSALLPPLPPLPP